MALKKRSILYQLLPTSMNELLQDALDAHDKRVEEMSKKIDEDLRRLYEHNTNVPKTSLNQSILSIARRWKSSILNPVVKAWGIFSSTTL